MSRLRINKMGVLSVAKIQAVIGLVVGLIVGVIYALLILIYTLLGASLVGSDARMAVGGGGVVIDRIPDPVYDHWFYRRSDRGPRL